MRRALAALGAAVVVTACGRSAPQTEQPDPGVVHVHGLDVDAEDGSLYIATHTGLFRVVEGRPAERVGEYWHDLMGFAVAGPGDLIASGHPDLRDDGLQRPDAPPLLGLVQSSDHGSTWRETSLLGEVDFHALEAAHGLVFGADATSGAFMVSEDRRTWETRSRPSLLDFAVDPEDQQQVIVGLTQTGLLLSVDGGGRTRPPRCRHRPGRPALTRRRRHLDRRPGPRRPRGNRDRQHEWAGVRFVHLRNESLSTLPAAVRRVALREAGALRIPSVKHLRTVLRGRTQPERRARRLQMPP